MTDENLHSMFQAMDDIVITGISCRLPESDNMEEFRHHLFLGEDMVTENNRRWKPDYLGLPRRAGKLKDLCKFDAHFFGILPRQANAMDPQLRILMEVTYEAIVDSGYNPEKLRGSQTGVFIGVTNTEALKAWTANPETAVGYSLTGCSRSMFANRLSFFFDFKGPSYVIDTACSSSMMALDQAIASIRAGNCDSAIVGGSNICIDPITTLQFQKLGLLSPDGKCKSFDASGDGYCRSEGVVVIRLQKASAARRIYATLVHSKTNSDGRKDQGITFPSGEIQKQLLKETYTEAGVDPKLVTYVEAHGTGTKAGDTQEVNSIVEAFCGDKNRPLLIGSVKSNMGHPEPVAGLAAIAKMILAMEERLLPGNLHFQEPNPDIPGLHDGRLTVVRENIPWSGGYIGINSFGFGGSNVHAILKSNDHEALNYPLSTHVFPRLCVYAGRTEDCVAHVLNKMQQNCDNIQMHTLLNESALSSPSSHPYRGYTVLNSKKTIQWIQNCPSDDRPVWYVFSGMGSQWCGMGRQMMEFEVFKQSISKLDILLKRHDLHLYKLITETEDDTYDNVVHSFVGIVAIQVALVDLLQHMGVRPNGFIGHSLGELGCAYTDGSLTAEETLLTAYWRGRCIQEAKLPLGAMAAVGLTWSEAKRQCPVGVVPACHNSVNSVTVSGHAGAVAKFVHELKGRDVFAKEVQSAGVAFHSPEMNKVIPTLEKALKKVISPKRRTSRWISTSIPEDQWSSDLAKFSSVEYCVNNLVSPVLFQEALQHIPDNAIVLEVAPHGLLQSILKRSLPSTCSSFGLMDQSCPDNVEFFYSSLGKCYCSGMAVDPLGVFPGVKYPVSTGTPMISPLVMWDHSFSWDVPTAEDFIRQGSGTNTECVYEIDTSEASKDHYIVDHVVKGQILYPAAGYLVLAWKTLATLKGQDYEYLPVLFEDVRFSQATVIPKSGTVKLKVSVLPATGEFEITEGVNLAVKGKINLLQQFDTEMAKEGQAVEETLSRTRADVYKGLRLQGNNYGPKFQGIVWTNSTGDRGQLEWSGNWVTFLDALLQMSIIENHDYKSTVPSRIRTVHLHPEVHISSVKEQSLLPVYVDRCLDRYVSGGVEINGIHNTPVLQHIHQIPPILEVYSFVPYHESIPIKSDLQQYIKDCMGYSQHMLTEVCQFDDTWDSLPLTWRQPYGRVGIDKVVKYSSKSSCGLMQTLHTMFSASKLDSFPCSAKTVVKDFKHKLATDVFLTLLLEAKVLKPCLDIVLENCMKNRVCLLEVSSLLGPLYNNILPLFRSQPQITVHYMLTNPSDDDIQDKASVSAVKWDISDPAPPSIGQPDLIILRNILHCQRNISTALANVRDACGRNGFVMVIEATMNFPLHQILEGFENICIPADHRSQGCYLDQEAWRDLFHQNDFEITYHRTDCYLSNLFLLRRKNQSVENQIVISVDDPSFIWVDTVRSTLSDSHLWPAGKNMWLRSKDSYSGIIGMCNCLRKEYGVGRVRCILCKEDIDENSEEFSSLVRKDLVMNIKQGQNWGSYRYLPLSEEINCAEIPCKHVYADITRKGDLSSLCWIQSPHHLSDSAFVTHKELCHVYYASLNFRDVMLATGKLSPDAIPGYVDDKSCLLGMEFSGRRKDNSRVMGLLPAKGLATTVAVDKRFLWEIPDSWSLREAATVPVAYATAYYALVFRGRIQKGDRVLVHSGSGGVGQAAISVALSYGCEVYTTVSSLEKKEYLKKTFPSLKDGNFTNSRDLSFESDILRATNGKGVSVVLNSLSEERLQASLRVLGTHGKFLEIGKFDLSNNTPLGMSIFLKNISFHGVQLDALFDPDNNDWIHVAKLVSEGIRAGVVKPLNSTVFSHWQLEEAFRYMTQGKHIGKVLVEVRSEDNTSPLLIQASPRFYCSPQKSYLIAGGLGGFGLELCQWLVSRGCRNLLIASRSGIRSGYHSRRVRLWRELGVRVNVSTQDIRTIEGTGQLVDEALRMGPLGGVFNLAMVLRDGLMASQTVEKFENVCDPKVTGTLNLDMATRNSSCRETLDMFVVFSSVVSGRGNAGQANYGFANSVMERVMEKRTADGLPGIAIQWGPIGDVGVVMEQMGGNDTVIAGTHPQRIQSCLNVLDMFLTQPHPVVSSFVMATSEEVERKEDIMADVSRIMGWNDMSNINSDRSLAELGLDSLMSVELKQTLERDYNLVMSTHDISVLTVKQLREIRISGTNVEKEDEKNCDFAQIMPSSIIENLNEVINGRTPLFIVHSVDGLTASLHTVASKIRRPVYGIQCTAEVPLDSVEVVAAFYLKKLQTFQPNGPYCLSGYSYGACVALEMALQLQQHYQDTQSLAGTLLLLDGSRRYKETFGDTGNLRNPREEEVQALCMFVQQFMSVEHSWLSQSLRQQKNLEGCIDVAVEELLTTGQFNDSAQLKLAATSFCRRVCIALKYRPGSTFTGDVLLIRASDRSAETEKMVVGLDLQELCHGKVTVAEVPGNQQTFLLGESAKRVASLIDSTLL